MSIHVTRAHDTARRARNGVPRGVAAPGVPAWVADRFGVAQGIGREVRPGTFVGVAHGQGVALITVRIAGAAGLSADAFEGAARAAYEAIAAELRALPARHPVRFWNHIPGIHRRAADGRDWYMVFNAGRFAAFETWYGGVDAFDRSIATATGVGHAGSDFVVHCLASETPGRAVANPRQVQSFRYSRKFGPVPPCFARATVLGNAVLVGGTASIRGEETLHGGNMAGQVEETVANLTAVVRKAADDVEEQVTFGRYRELRIYAPKLTAATQLETEIRHAFPNVTRVEIIEADLCRPDLLVEIEGLAILD
jgi:chorismate lyase/3-hydroxybenzoate synthase